MILDVTRLLEILDQQNKIIKELLDLASDQLQALMLDDLNKIMYITNHQEYFGRKLAALEQQRLIIIEEYTHELGMEINNFSDLLLHVSSNDYVEIQKNRDEIINGCQKLKDKQDHNALFLNQGLKYTEKIMEVLNPKKSSIYGKTGDIKRTGKTTIVDTNV
jgi:flagellar biosynthesis/type III secretory pathway chaperone